MGHVDLFAIHEVSIERVVLGFSPFVRRVSEALSIIVRLQTRRHILIEVALGPMDVGLCWRHPLKYYHIQSEIKVYLKITNAQKYWVYSMQRLCEKKLREFLL